MYPRNKSDKKLFGIFLNVYLNNMIIMINELYMGCIRCRKERKKSDIYKKVKKKSIIL